MKRRFECMKCGRRGAFGSFTGRATWVNARGWVRRLLDVHGAGVCRNVIACYQRQQRKARAAAARKRAETGAA